MQGQYTHQIENLLNIGITSIAEYLNNEKYKEYILKLKDTSNLQYGKKLNFFVNQEKPAVPEDNVTEKKVLSYLDFDLDEAIGFLIEANANNSTENDTGSTQNEGSSTTGNEGNSAESWRWEVLNEQ